MEEFDYKNVDIYKVSHEWNHLKYTLIFKDKRLQILVVSDKYNERAAASKYYRIPDENHFKISDYTLKGVVGFLCRNNEIKDIKCFLELFSNDEEYFEIIKNSLKEEAELMSKKLECINIALEE